MFRHFHLSLSFLTAAVEPVRWDKLRSTPRAPSLTATSCFLRRSDGPASSSSFSKASIYIKLWRSLSLFAAYTLRSWTKSPSAEDSSLVTSRSDRTNPLPCLHQSLQPHRTAVAPQHGRKDFKVSTKTSRELSLPPGKPYHSPTMSFSRDAWYLWCRRVGLEV